MHSPRICHHHSPMAVARRRFERQVIDEGTAIWKAKRKRELLLEAEEKKLDWKMLTTYNPWGRPGNGAPMPGALRKTKWIFDGPSEEINVQPVTSLQPRSVMSWGRPGHGAPIRTPTGKPRAHIKADPLIRFQVHDLARAAVENDLRYKTTPHDKENYRRELDAIVCQKKKAEKMENESTMNLEDQKGWTNDVVFRKLERDKAWANEREQIYEITGGGVELVPLLAKHRMVTRCPLTTTDITRMSRICNQFSKPISTAPEYFRQLCNQVEEKEKQKQQDQIEETVQSNRHFETWQQLWGRPGHGAPKSLSQRENLEFLLYRMPSRRITSPSNKKAQ